MTIHTPTSTPAVRYALVVLPAGDDERDVTTPEGVAAVVEQIDDLLTDGFHSTGYAYPLHELDDATRADLAHQLAALPPYDAATRDQLAAVAEHPAAAYVDSTTAPLPGRVSHGVNPTTNLLDRVESWERVRSAAAPEAMPSSDAHAADLLRAAVQVIRSVSVDTLRAAAEDVFDTAMPAYVARWLEGRAGVLEVGADVHDPDIMDAAIAEATAAARIRNEQAFS